MAIRIGLHLTPARILVLGFAAIILTGALLLSLPIASKDGQSLRFLNALFTATSAVCVTGLVVVDTGTHFTRFGQTVIISLIQIGGLGFMTMATMIAVLLGRRIGLKERILIQESFNQFSLAGLVRLIRSVVLMTLFFEVVGGIILSLRFMGDYPLDRALAYGFFHSISAFCNAGFDLFGQVHGAFSSITHYASDWTVTLTIGGLIVFGGLGFPVIMELYKNRGAKRLTLHAKMVIRATVILIVLGALVIFALEYTNRTTLAGLNPSGKFLGSLFQSITPRTAGYNSLDIGKMRVASWMIMIILMFIGASPSSTGGGVKTTTFGVLMATVWATIKNKEEVEIFQRRLPKDLIYKALTITMIALTWITLVTMVMSLVEPFVYVRLLFEVVSAFGTVGLTTGITPALTDLSKWLLAITMFMGRLGPLTVMVALSQSKTCSLPCAKCIEDRVIIG